MINKRHTKLLYNAFIEPNQWINGSYDVEHTYVVTETFPVECLKDVGSSVLKKKKKLIFLI